MKHSAKWDRCVKKVKRSHSAVDPYAVCTARIKNPPKKSGWFEIRVNGKIVYTAASLESAKIAARAYHRKHPGSKVTGHRI